MTSPWQELNQFLAIPFVAVILFPALFLICAGILTYLWKRRKRKHPPPPPPPPPTPQVVNYYETHVTNIILVDARRETVLNPAGDPFGLQIDYPIGIPPSGVMTVRNLRREQWTMKPWQPGSTLHSFGFQLPPSGVTVRLPIQPSLEELWKISISDPLNMDLLTSWVAQADLMGKHELQHLMDNASPPEQKPALRATKAEGREDETEDTSQ